jgi:hypothetical protein
MSLPSTDLDLCVDWQVGVLLFDDGSQKGLASFMTWLGVLMVHPSFGEEAFRHHQVVTLIKSLMNIPTVYKCQHTGGLDSTIARIVKQNQDAKAQPVSSYQWSCILRRMNDGGP